MNFNPGPSSQQTPNLQALYGTQISLAQLAKPTPDILANTSITYETPDGRLWQSNGASLGSIVTVSADGASAANGVVVSVSAAVQAARNAKIAAFAKGPMIPAPGWAAVTVYATDQTVTIANGVHITASVGGTSGATIPVLSTTVLDGRPIADGSVVWYVNGMRKTASDLDAPTITSANTAAGVGLTATLISGTAGQVPLRTRGKGGRITDLGIAQVAAYCFALGNASASGNATVVANADGFTSDAFTTNQWSVEWDVTDYKFGPVFHNSAGRVIVEIDNQPVAGDLVALPAVSGFTIAFDFNGVVKQRRLRVTGSGGIGPAVQGIALSAQGFFNAPPVPTDTLMALGDSFFAVSPPASNTSGYLTHEAFYLERYLGVDNLINVGEGSAGYISALTNYYNMLALLLNPANRILFTEYAPKHIYINAVYNDVSNGFTPAAICAAALATWQAARALFPAAKISIGDGRSSSTGPSNAVLNAAAALKIQFAAWNDGNSKFIELVTASASTAIVQGTGNAGIAIGTGNSGVMTSTDAFHYGPTGSRFNAAMETQKISVAWNGSY